MARKHQVNQKQIAKDVGLSQATVSLILSGRRVGSDKTSQRVLRAARKLGYRPNLLVRGMQTGKSRMIGVMMPPCDFFWSEVLYGIHDVLAAADHVPITLWTAHAGSPTLRHNDPAPLELEQVYRLLDRRVDGVILWPRFAELFREHIHEFSSRQLPIVTIDHRLPPKFGADYVGSDEASGGALVAKHFHDLGHRVVGHIAGPADRTWASERRKAFEAAVGRLGGSTCVTLDTPSGDPGVGIDAARQLLAQPNRPTAIFAASDYLAKMVYQAAREAHLRIPHDLSVVGFSDSPFAADMSPPLTTVRQPSYEIGRRAAEIVLARSAGSIAKARITEELPVTLVVRESTQSR
jgi:DNA-binding LacI/PurR family transcriptional regulator